MAAASLAIAASCQALGRLSLSSPRVTAGAVAPCRTSSVCVALPQIGARRLLLGQQASSLFGQGAVTFGKVASRGTGRLNAVRITAADKAPAVKKKIDSAIKRAKQAEKRRMYHRARRSEMGTRMKKVFVALRGLQKAGAGGEEDAMGSVENLIGEAYSIIDKAVKVGTIHRNKGNRRKSRLARAKRAVNVALGLYTPQPAAATS